MPSIKDAQLAKLRLLRTELKQMSDLYQRDPRQYQAIKDRLFERCKHESWSHIKATTKVVN